MPLSLAGFVFGGADKIEEAGLLAVYVAFGTLLEQGVELEQGVVVRPRAQPFDVLSRTLECVPEIAHEMLAPLPGAGSGRVDNTHPGKGQRATMTPFA